LPRIAERGAIGGDDVQFAVAVYIAECDAAADAAAGAWIDEEVIEYNRPIRRAVIGHAGRACHHQRQHNRKHQYKPVSSA
jgi:hypothetical protein